MKYTPHPYQRYAKDRLIQSDRLAAFIDMGLGKTSIVLSAFADLYAGLEVKGMLIIAPVRVAANVWPDEVAKWDHLSWMSVSVVRGTPIARKVSRGDKLLGSHEMMCAPRAVAVQALSAGAPIYATNYENLPAMCAWMHKQKELPFDMIVFDESSKMKSASAKRFRLLKPLLSRFKRRVILTGTPTPNSMADLWSQIYLLDEGKRLGTYVTHFRNKYFDFNKYTYELKLKRGADVAIQAKIRDLVVCLRKEDYLSLPPVVTNDIKVELPKAARKQYDKLREELAVALSGALVEAVNAASLSGKCRQFTSGAVYETCALDEAPAGKWLHAHDAKLDAVESVVEEQNGAPLLVCYEFKHELARLRKRFPTARWFGEKDERRLLADWNAGKVPVLLAHPASVGHGLNLQGGGNTLLWTSGTFNADNYAQMVARLHRQGQTKPVIAHRLICPGTVDEVWVQAVAGKLTGQAALLKALRANVLSVR